MALKVGRSDALANQTRRPDFAERNKYNSQVVSGQMIIQIRTKLDEDAYVVHPHQPIRGPKARADKSAHQLEEQNDYNGNVVAKLPSGSEGVDGRPSGDCESN
ncbi:MAG: hypothetical protein DMG93_05335 [Acidobacteria bacterium]|nr:MAG: hypothetical protein DMG93_05335 [Acidobacteriota bacterium]